MPTPRAALPRDLEQRFKDLEAKIRAAATAATRRPKFVVSEGDLTVSGGDLVVDGGDFLLLDTDGSTVFRLGPQAQGDRGVSIYREDGSLALGVRKVFSESTQQTLHLYDADGNAIFTEAVFGTGFDHPQLPIPVTPYSATSAPLNVGPFGYEPPAVSSGSFTTTHRAQFPRYNVFSDWVFRVSASDATTAGEVQVIDVGTGTPLGAFLSPPWVGVRAAGSTGYDPVTPPSSLVLPGAVAEVITLAVQVRRTAGSGSLTIAVDRAHGS